MMDGGKEPTLGICEFTTTELVANRHQFKGGANGVFG
jgi:hypothetical protein